MVHSYSSRRSVRAVAICFTLVATTPAAAFASEAAGPTAGVSASAALAVAPEPPRAGGSLAPGVEPQPSTGPEIVAPIASEPAKPKGFLDFNTYPYMTDVDNDSVFTLNALAKLPYGSPTSACST